MDYIVSLRRLPTPNTSIEILDRQRYFGGTAGNLFAHRETRVGPAKDHRIRSVARNPLRVHPSAFPGAAPSIDLLLRERGGNRSSATIGPCHIHRGTPASRRGRRGHTGFARQRHLLA